MRTRERLWPALWDSLVLVSLVVCAFDWAGAYAGERDSTSAEAREQFFEQNVRPLLAENCYSCHGDKKQKGGLRLDSLEAILKGGESGPAVVPGKPDESLLVEAINYAGPEMPPDGKLAPEKIAVLTRWVSPGAPWPRGDRAAHASISSTTAARAGLTAADRALWSLQPIREPHGLRGSLNPGIARWSHWSRNPIDRFILKALLDHGLTPAPEATRSTLIRRVDVRPDRAAADSRGS